ncbi:MAG: RIP metalloprotease RseP [Candidatus Doudnabacteria bacterium RIFCSPHIGHO2_02_FULL_48_21]|uniref:Zinc metalloprotease n=1 Tax=Candidatus Doudnabacteria bacterium RIFCSPLOWO2_02_FULL_48_13 TaxID=1817845 RepID=A0A1F5QCU4_9BACT|nr:MAG: RIP metalloprotease RseP [Candidatus Doudnabacteria bacterium RIFCSPHIGHO2_01_48_18]OGE79172.1 MAG: RIP metalloprotease RseP [Candidatus Doudnabacteria bacterium RIFCSPHIGHO2_01_FULL_48_180]OGE91804.1 MAG: RIP metalloprotease RseP [Candidatus Doudnabacteria bacterium RIFCSPHIGHO2_12_FULL_47_25]OGE93654.1 MAG: RIP metalloprotease RseP [Candidatus Doudnabacteria bacterium RIFCSPHIGHO2_02_FULL_48_21]OGE97935.1 MAG: RIP metalloprotease RseP [Candidatus Doudnabacteria bacterium RIFCSPLOWO2_0
MSIILTIIAFIFILGILVFVHELGHFLAARRAGMKVEEFGFGFPPRLFGVRRGETLYSINLIPLGGFVKITGEEGVSDDPRSFANGSFGHRLFVLLAGVLMNFVLGWFLLFLGFCLVGTPIEIGEGTHLGNARLSQEKLTIIAVEPNSPAEIAGFKHGDLILSVDDKKFTNIDELIAYTKSRAENPVIYELQRGTETLERSATPRANPPEGSGPVGFAPAMIAVAKYPIFDALKMSFVSFYYKTTGVFGAFGQLIGKLFSSGKLAEGLAGPVGIAVLTKDFLALGIVYLVQFTAVLSINLGIINAFPFPALDGGRVLFLLIEKIRGVKSVKIEQTANIVGFLLLMLLMVAVSFRDFGRYSDEFRRLFDRIL